MRELYNEFFYIPKHGKIREKVMLTRIVSTIAIVIMCLAAMSITAYAYFSYNITSGSNTIKAASFYTDVTVQITDADGNAVETITTNTSDHKSHSATLNANTTYTITVQHNARSTAQTGFVIITADKCETKYHTQQLGRDGEGNTYTITFELTPGANTVVTFRSHWGTSSFYADFKEIGENDERYIINGDDVKLTIDGVAPSDGTKASDNTESKGETTTTPTTDTTTPTTGTGSSTPTNETTTSETTGTSEPTSTTEPSSSETETTTQTPEPAATETTSTEATTETQPATENEETTGATTTEASE